jgi:hypothetical protein
MNVSGSFSGPYATHTKALSELLDALMKGKAQPQHLRDYWAQAIAQGVPLRIEFIVPPLHDDLVMVEAYYMIGAAPWLRAWHPEALERLTAYLGKVPIQWGVFGWNAWCGGNKVGRF